MPARKTPPPRLDSGLLIPLALVGLLIVAAVVHSDLVLSFQAPVAAGDRSRAFVFYEEVSGLSTGRNPAFLYRRLRPRHSEQWSKPVRARGQVAAAAVAGERLVVLFDSFYSVYDATTLERKWSFDYEKLGFAAMAVTASADGTPLLFGVDTAGHVRAARIDGTTAHVFAAAKLAVPPRTEVHRIDASACAWEPEALVAIEYGPPRPDRRRRDAFGRPTSELRGTVGGGAPVGSVEDGDATTESGLLLVPFREGRFGRKVRYDPAPKAWSLCTEPVLASGAGVFAGGATGASEAAARTQTSGRRRGLVMVGWPARLAVAPLAGPGARSAAAREEGELAASERAIAIWRLSADGELEGEIDRITSEEEGILDAFVSTFVGADEPRAIEATAAVGELLILEQADDLLRLVRGTRQGSGGYRFAPAADLATMSTASRTLVWTWALLLIGLLVVIGYRLSSYYAAARAGAEGGPPSPPPPPAGGASGASPPPPSADDDDRGGDDGGADDGEGDAGDRAAPGADDDETEARDPVPAEVDGGGARGDDDERAPMSVLARAVGRAASGTEPRENLASAFERVVAFSLDFILCWGLIYLTLLDDADGRLTRVVWDVPEDRVLVMLALAAVVMLYFTVCESLFGQTLGKRLMGIEVRDQDGRRVTPRAAVLRNLFRFGHPHDVLYVIDLLALAVSARAQRPGDLIAGTIVRRVRAEQPAAEPHARPAGGAGGDGDERP